MFTISKAFFLPAFLVALLIAEAPANAQQLRILHVKSIDNPVDDPVLFPEYSTRAYLDFQTAIDSVSFQTNWIIFNEHIYRGNGHYQLVVDTVRQSLRISAPGYQFFDLDIPRTNPQDALYYIITSADQELLDEIMGLIGAGQFADAIEQLNVYLPREDIPAHNRHNAQYLMAMCLFELGRVNESKNTLRTLLEQTLEFEPPTAGAPTEIKQMHAAILDSLDAVPPRQPEGLQARFMGNRVILTWLPNTVDRDLEGYHVYRGQNQNDLSLIASVRRNSFTDEDVEAFSTYYYEVRAYDNYIPSQVSTPSELIEIEITPPWDSMMVVDLVDPSAIRKPEIRQLSDSLLGISYNLIGEFHQTYDVSLALSNNGGDSYNIFPEALSGHFGAGVQDGEGRQIIWNVLADFPAGLSGRQFNLRIDARPNPLADQVRVAVSPDSLVEAFPVVALNDTLVLVRYALRGDAKKNYTVNLNISDDQEQEFRINPESFSGDWGSGQTAGPDKRIEWNVLQFFPQGLTGNINLHLTVSEEPPPKRHAWKYVAGGSVLAAGILTLILDPFAPPASEPPVASNPPDPPDPQ